MGKILLLILLMTTPGFAQNMENWLNFDTKSFKQWDIITATSRMDDSSIILVSQNLIGQNRNMFVIQCQEGSIQVTYAIFGIVIPEFAFVDEMIWTTYRIDSQPAVTMKWYPIASSNGIALVDSEAKEFILDIYNAKKLYIRIGITEYEYIFDISNGDILYSKVLETCLLENEYMEYGEQ